ESKVEFIPTITFIVSPVLSLVSLTVRPLSAAQSIPTTCKDVPSKLKEILSSLIAGGGVTMLLVTCARPSDILFIATRSPTVNLLSGVLNGAKSQLLTSSSVANN
ncbi:hypothetical protein MNBD_GAMMA05-1726, partial [hydrothermal vent metagenome]